MVPAEDLDALVFDVGDVRLAIDLRQVLEVCLRTEIHSLPGVELPVAGVVQWRGLPLMGMLLHQRLGQPPRDAGLFDHFIVVRTARRQLVLVVDRVADVTMIPSAMLQDTPPSARPIAGVLVLPTGVHYVLDLEALLDLEHERAFDEAIARRDVEA